MSKKKLRVVFKDIGLGDGSLAVEVTTQEWAALVKPVVDGKLPLDSSTVDENVFATLMARAKPYRGGRSKYVVPLV